MKFIHITGIYETRYLPYNLLHELIRNAARDLISPPPC